VFLGGVIGTLFWILKSNYEKQLKEKDEEIKYLRSKLEELHSYFVRRVMGRRDNDES